MCDIDVSISIHFCSTFLLNETLVLTIVWVFLETPVCPSLTLGRRDGYFQVPCAPGAQRAMGPLSRCAHSCVRLVSHRRGGMVWGEPLVPSSSCRRQLGPCRVSLGRSQRGRCSLLDWQTRERAARAALSRQDGKATPSRSRACAGAAELCFRAQPRPAPCAAGFGFTGSILGPLHKN